MWLAQITEVKGRISTDLREIGNTNALDIPFLQLKKNLAPLSEFAFLRLSFSVRTYETEYLKYVN